MLNNFGIGWRNLFEKHLEYAITLLPDISISSVERYEAMLRIKFYTSNEHLQYIVDSLAYRIERVSAKTCEKCGVYGLRRIDEWLEEPMCLCLSCYTLMVDEILNNKE